MCFFFVGEGPGSNFLFKREGRPARRTIDGNSSPDDVTEVVFGKFLKTRTVPRGACFRKTSAAWNVRRIGSVKKGSSAKQCAYGAPVTKDIDAVNRVSPVDEYHNSVSGVYVKKIDK